MKIAIVHEWLTILGGSEKIIILLNELYPEAPIHTFVYDKGNMEQYFGGMEIRTSFIQNIPFAAKKYTSLLPLMPYAIEQFDFRGYDVVISSSTACAKGIITDADTLHICYCNTPMRYAWDLYHEYKNTLGQPKRLFMAWYMKRMRLWDRLAADRVDCFIANSDNVARRVKKHYMRKSEVIYPPVDTKYYTPGGVVGDYYLVMSRLVSYKKIEVAIEAFNNNGKKLIVIGDGPEKAKLQKIAKGTIEFKGRLSDEELLKYYRGCKAFIFPGEEDFGITPLEAQACGRPVIAYGKGGVLETVVNEKTGLYFNEQTANSMNQTIEKFEGMEDEFDSKAIRENAERFSNEIFKKEIDEYVSRAYHEHITRMGI